MLPIQDHTSVWSVLMDTTVLLLGQPPLDSMEYVSLSVILPTSHIFLRSAVNYKCNLFYFVLFRLSIQWTKSTVCAKEALTHFGGKSMLTSLLNCSYITVHFRSPCYFSCIQGCH